MKVKSFISILLILVMAACTSVPRFTSNAGRFKNDPPSERFKQYYGKQILETQTGVASFYADDFHGKITYSGEEYDMYGYTAAHPSYPMGTIIKVTNESNGRNIIIPINDRMPFRPDRIIDLSLGTAQELDMVGVGITEVKVEVLEWEKERNKEPLN